MDLDLEREMDAGGWEFGGCMDGCMDGWVNGI